MSVKFASTEKTVTGYGFWGEKRIRKAGGSLKDIPFMGFKR